MLANVSAKLLDEFVENLQHELRVGSHPTGPQVTRQQPEPVNLLALPVPRNQCVRRVGAMAIGIAVAILVARWFGLRRGFLRRGRRRSPRCAGS